MTCALVCCGVLKGYPRKANKKGVVKQQKHTFCDTTKAFDSHASYQAISLGESHKLAIQQPFGHSDEQPIKQSDNANQMVC